jgi:hypothetical protein
VLAQDIFHVVHAELCSRHRTARNRTWGRLSVGRCAFDAIVGARLNNLLSHAHVTEDRPKYEREPDDDPHGADTLYIFYVVLFR